MRNELRFLSNALVYVIDDSKHETKASLRDLSQSGLAIKSESFIDIEPNSPYVIAIIPEKETNLEKFQLEIESRWIKLNKSKMESGFSVIVPFEKKEFQDYLEYLAQKGKLAPTPEDGDSKTESAEANDPEADDSEAGDLQAEDRRLADRRLGDRRS